MSRQDWTIAAVTDSTQYDPEPFEMVPHWLLMDTNLSANAIRLYLVLRKHRNYRTGEAWPGKKRLALLCGISLSTVHREIANLAKAGAITISQRRTDEGDADTNLYRVHWDKGGGVTEKRPRVRKGTGGHVTQTPKLIPIDNKDVPQSILTMDDGPEHDAAYLRFIKGEL